MKKPARSIPFIQLFAKGMGGERNARMALRNPKTPPELRAELERYLADTASAAAQDQQQLLDRTQQETDKYRSGRKPGARNKPTLRLEAQFDKLYRDNPDCSAEDIRTLKGAKSIKKMGKSTVARHWSDAKKRAGK